MELNMSLEVYPDELFDVISRSLEYDIKEATGKTIRSSAIEPGYTYKKKLNSKLGKEASVKVTIEEFSLNEAYVARFDSASGINRIKYLIEPIDGGEATGLTYIEEYEGAKQSYDWNGALINWLLTVPNKKRMKKQFKYIESQIIENRSKSPEELALEAQDYYD